ncbi:IstB-like ATP binding protein [Bradyrhizobium shewense]|uniref:IstB-like ATP binding protein n=1 Tax=Bradyrhizobium shewense TaxID=1761772 RepID=A0A1C3XVH6_9BRAD|nr:ATP-binding protein [Bradyrhizobium shewense]SCB56034.1 IstB-like ATP binding protein [Bradyrhizobium shewense]
MLSKAQAMALAAGDVWLKTGANLLLFGPPGGGKAHLGAAIGLALVEDGWRVLFARTTDLVQRLQVARRELALESAIAKLDRYDLLILDDITSVSKDQVETSVLFELIATRYERRSLLITANQHSANGAYLPRSSNDAGSHRSFGPPRDDPRDECRELPSKSCPRSQARSRPAAGSRHSKRTRESGD